MKKILLILVICISALCLTGCASWDSALKDFESETKGGLKRIVKVYSVDGQLLSEYEGRINIEYDDNRVIFQIDGDKRVAIYTKTATVVVEDMPGSAPPIIPTHTPIIISPNISRLNEEKRSAKISIIILCSFTA